MKDLDLSRALYPRVTEIIRKQTIEEFNSIPTDVLANASVRGVKVHEYCSTYLKGLWLPDIEEEYVPYLNSFINWAQQNVEEPIQFGERLFDDKLQFSGEFDLIVTLKSSKKKALIDIKTTSTVSKSWAIQLAAYKHLCVINNYQIDEVYNIHLKKTKAASYSISPLGEKSILHPSIVKVYSIEHSDLSQGWEIFSSALTCYNYFHRKKEEQTNVSV